MAKWTVKVLKFLTLHIKSPDFDGVIMDSYKLVWLSVEERNIIAVLI